MRILLDENLPASLVSALNELGHHAESINSLRLKGIDNGRLYREVAHAYDLCFTRDAGFVHNVRQSGESSPVKLLRVTIPQQPVKPFVAAFILEFQGADWASYQNGDEWP